jgi:hypothetical protein
MLGWLALAAVCAATPDGSEGDCEARAGEGQGQAQDSSAAPDEEASPAPSSGQAAIGAQWLWASGKAMPGLLLGGSYRMVRFDIETSLIALTDKAPEFETQFLGSQFGFHLMLRPLYDERWEVAGGLGTDCYSLWNIHGDAFEAALSARISGHFWISERVGVFATARAYPVATSGLELGTSRDGSGGLPVLFGTGIEWGFR